VTPGAVTGLSCSCLGPRLVSNWSRCTKGGLVSVPAGLPGRHRPRAGHVWRGASAAPGSRTRIGRRLSPGGKADPARSEPVRSDRDARPVRRATDPRARWCPLSSRSRSAVATCVPTPQRPLHGATAGCTTARHHRRRPPDQRGGRRLPSRPPPSGQTGEPVCQLLVRRSRGRAPAGRASGVPGSCTRHLPNTAPGRTCGAVGARTSSGATRPRRGDGRHGP
jgi:hypothetical protein